MRKIGFIVLSGFLAMGGSLTAMAHPHPKSKAAAERADARTPAPKKSWSSKTSQSKNVIRSMVDDETMAVTVDVETDHHDGESGPKVTKRKRVRKGEMGDQRIVIMKAGPDETPLDVQEDGTKMIMLTGETMVKVGPDGSVTIMNGDQVIDGAGFTAAMQGRASAEFTDEGEAAEITVEKIISQDADGRRIRVVIEMDTESE